MSRPHTTWLRAAAVAVPLAALLSTGAGCRTRLLDAPAGDGAGTTTAAKGSALGLVSFGAGGELVIAGTSRGSPENLLFGHFAGDGSPDLTTGAAGTRTSDVAPLGASVGFGVAALDGGQFVVAGRAWLPGQDPKFLVTRHLDDGRLDPAFGAGGVVILDAHPNPSTGAPSACQAFAVANQPGAGILAGGNAGIYHAGSGTYWTDMVLVRLNASDGRLDATFGNAGVVVLAFGATASIRHIAVERDGRIVVAGYLAVGGVYKVAVLRLLRDGKLDDGFGDRGIAVMSVGRSDQAYAVTPLEAGGYILTGQSTANNEGGDAKMLTGRLDAAGRLDPGFGDGGWVVTRFPGGDAVGRGVAERKSGYLVGGYAVGAEGNQDFALARYDARGQPDECGFPGGQFTFAVTPGEDDYVNAMALQPDGTPVLAGSTGTSVAVRRFPELRCAGDGP